jgi:GNAT superfamily N-acetyltransferase
VPWALVKGIVPCRSSTVPEVRHQGIGSAITQAALQQAREVGYRIDILHSSETGKVAYCQLGFVEKYRMSHFVWKKR